MASNSRLTSMIKIAQEAGDAALAIQQSGQLGIENKEGVFGTHFLTSADTRSEEIILKGLQEFFPGVQIISEEKENDPDIAPDAFLVDPIDGTPCFIHGCEEWGVMITKLQDGLPELAVIYIPGRNILASAARGEGCYINGVQVTPKPWPKELHDKRMIGIELGQWWTKGSLSETVLLPLIEKFTVRSLLSAAYGTIAMLRGETQAWVNLGVGWPWDFAPGWLFMKESGLFVSGPDGQELTFTRVEHMDVVYWSDDEIAQQILPLTTAWAKNKG